MRLLLELYILCLFLLFIYLFSRFNLFKSLYREKGCIPKGTSIAFFSVHEQIFQLITRQYPELTPESVLS